MNYKSVIMAKAPVLFLVSMLSACGGGGNNGSQDAPLDTEAPVIALNGSASETVFIDAIFSDPGVVVTDNVDSNLSAVTTGNVNTANIGVYTLTYNVSDAQGNAATEVSRVITVVDNIAPVITLNGDISESIVIDSLYIDSGAEVFDNVDSNLTVNISGSVNSSVAGEYVLTYNAIDNAGNQALTTTRTVTVIDGIAFNIPSVFYEVFAYGIEFPVFINRDIISSNSIMSSSRTVFENGNLGGYESQIQYLYNDNSWLENDLASLPITLTKANTHLEGSNYSKTIVEVEDLSNKTTNIFQSDEYFDSFNKPDFLMPEGSVKYTTKYQSTGMHYRLFGKHSLVSQNDLTTLLSEECGLFGYLTMYVDSEFLYQAYIPCNQTSNTAGTLFGRNEGDENIPDVGTWALENISDSNVKVLILEVDPSMLDEDSYFLHNSRIYSVIENEVWHGVKRGLDYSYDFIQYNQIAFDAIISAFNESN